MEHLGYADCTSVFRVILLGAIHSTTSNWGTRFARERGKKKEFHGASVMNEGSLYNPTCLYCSVDQDCTRTDSETCYMIADAANRHGRLFIYP